MSARLHLPLTLLFLFWVGATAAAQQGPYVVVINVEGQYAIWTSEDDPQEGWKTVGYGGSLEQCANMIKKSWTDKRPVSMRKKYKKKMKDGYVVIVNHEEQYMIWPRDEYVPDDWDLAGAGGSYDDCDTFIMKNWTDMRPLSLRLRMDE